MVLPLLEQVEEEREGTD